MQKLVVREGDLVTLVVALTTPPVSATLTPPPPFPLQGSAGFRVEGHVACVPDDIESLRIAGVGYVVPPTFPLAGLGTVELKVPRGNRAQYARTAQGKEVVVDGGPLDLVFTPTTPASNPPAKDEVKKYKGTATLTCVRGRPVTAGPAS
ncbi:hypothetical protein [Streptomyces hiroshimensis]|uniref:Uncharacterized protein n=1 Tax=Streptomyces hiroshimensis TaxID=66424 RepID=A0ABQ2Z454_9ACTN|nr:hypothetical protein [Streptomyces hiroshimensis]GGY02876.1 hypothetical protein GCM10010324_57340 [Streptomyces hiroshimensis]